MEQKDKNICERFGIEKDEPISNSIVGLAIKSLKNDIIHGMRINKVGNTNGWYIWTGEFSNADDFFSPVCVEHISNYIPIDLTEYLNLPPGYRFLIDGDKYEDIWFDENLLST